MPNQNTTGILVAAGVVGLLVIIAVLKGLANSISGFLHNLGMPAQFAGDINSVVFFGGLFLLIVLGLKALPRLSRL